MLFFLVIFFVLILKEVDLIGGVKREVRDGRSCFYINMEFGFVMGLRDFIVVGERGCRILVEFLLIFVVVWLVRFVFGFVVYTVVTYFIWFWGILWYLVLSFRFYRFYLVM